MQKTRNWHQFTVSVEEIEEYFHDFPCISRLSLQGGQGAGRAVTSICDLDCMSFATYDVWPDTSQSQSLAPRSCICNTKLITSLAPVQVRLEGGLDFDRLSAMR